MKEKEIRVRFAPSPTGPLHIGGVRTALYNHYFAKQHGGKMILRIEDTDQNRFVEGAETYIEESLQWAGVELDESPSLGGPLGPYNQSERGELYARHIQILLDNGWAYKAFDTPDELEAKREQAKEQGNHSWQYDAKTRGEMKNSISLTPEEVSNLESKNTPFVVRFKMPEDEIVTFHDMVRGEVEFSTSVLDDKVLMKADGFPTYHLANVVDDHEMQISHVIRGEEWLSSTPLHILLYKAFGWEDIKPRFAHLPLILKPQGQGKLSKRDGAKFGFPVFPLNWVDEKEQKEWIGFKETGFLPEGFINFLSFLGWNPGTEQEVYSEEQMVEIFDFNRVSKSGARFDYDKAKWFNQQHIQQKTGAELYPFVQEIFNDNQVELSSDKVSKIIELYQDRVELLPDFYTQSIYIYDDIPYYDEKMIRKKWATDKYDQFLELTKHLASVEDWNADSIERQVKKFMEEKDMGFGQVLPILRLAVCGIMQGPSIFEVMALLPQSKCVSRIEDSLTRFNEMV